MTRQLREPEAWREVARRGAEFGFEDSGLCWQVTRLLCEEEIDALTEALMHKRAARHAVMSPDRDAVYWAWPDCQYFAYPPGTETGGRILAALWLALEAEDEGK